MDVIVLDSVDELTQLAWMNDLKIFGESSYIYSDTNKLSLLTMNRTALNDPIIKGFIFDWGIANRAHIGRLFAALIPSENPVFGEHETMQDVTGSAEAMKEIVASGAAMALVLASSAAMTAVAASSAAMKEIAAVSSAVKAVEASTIAKDALFASPLKQSLTIPISTTWTLRRAGRV